MELHNVLDDQQQIEINRLQDIVQNLSEELDTEKQKLVNADLDYTKLTLIFQQLHLSILLSVGKEKYFEILKKADSCMPAEIEKYFELKGDV
jgi:hypothetical protein